MLQSSVIEAKAVERKPQDPYRGPAAARPSDWTTLYRVGAFSAIAIVVLIFVQGAVYVLWPPPIAVVDFFNVFQSNALLGLLDLDLLMIVDQLLIVGVLLALYVALSPSNQSLMLVATLSDSWAPCCSSFRARRPSVCSG
jgi:hypothetical protein